MHGIEKARFLQSASSSPAVARWVLGPCSSPPCRDGLKAQGFTFLEEWWSILPISRQQALGDRCESLGIGLTWLTAHRISSYSAFDISFVHIDYCSTHLLRPRAGAEQPHGTGRSGLAAGTRKLPAFSI